MYHDEKGTAQTEKPSSGSSPLGAPAIALPKGGGAIRGIGEKFAANPVTGTGSLTVPIATSPGRSDFGPQLALSYDSGAGNGSFGYGWSLSLPSIARKTDKGLPVYGDAGESDIFILSGAEDLAPVLKPNGSRFEDTSSEPGFIIRRYRPRIEGLFARIERWTNVADPGDVHWRSITPDNILSLYGKDPDSRVADPADPQRIFSWLICETRDDRGNAIIYRYKAEDGTGVDLSQAHERNRGKHDSPKRTANRYLKRICYGNRAPLLDTAGRRPRFLTKAEIDDAGWMFEVVFDYGEHDQDDPTPNEPDDWLCRRDPFSTYRAGFEVRTYRLCRRALMFHHFPDEVGVGRDCLVRSTTFTFRETPIAAFILAVTQSSYKRADTGGYLVQSLPPTEFEYSDAIIGQEVHEVDPASAENLPYGVDGAAYQWIDLDGEGLTGVLTEQGGGWFYKRNESTLAADKVSLGNSAHFLPVEQVASLPGGTFPGSGRWQFLDLAGDGQVDLVALDPSGSGFHERTGDQDWEPFRSFRSVPNLAWNDPNLKFIDLTGDGHSDVLITEEQAITWHPSLAEDGFGAATRVSVPADEERGPRVMFADFAETIFQADLSGDGLTDIVRIRNGEVCYWPNLGYGRFGAKVTMDDAPRFDTPDLFDPRRIRLVDIDGSGVTDIVYLGRNRTRFWYNCSGNSWSQAHELSGFPEVDNIASVLAVDLLGNGTACLVWSSPLPGAGQAPMKYLSLMAEGKPHLLTSSRNNLGAETRVRYVPSTYFYLRDKYEGRPWITRLPFPVHVVERVETYDHISRNRFVTRYAYHHGYFDGEEREFRGFSMVEQLDTEEFAAFSRSDAFPAGDTVDAAAHVPPVLTKSWFHTGALVDQDHISDFFAGLLDQQDRGEYYREPGLTDAQARALLLPDTVLPAGLTAEEEREACRALKGAMLRQEVYALDGTERAVHPYTIAEQDFTIEVLQRRGANRHAVFFTHAREAISYHYERNPADPRVAHTLTLEVNAFGSVLKEAGVGYGRRRPDPALPLQADRDKQTETLITYTENRVTNAIDSADDYRTPLPSETRTFELTGYTPTAASGRYQHGDFVRPDPVDPQRLTHIFDSEIAYEALPTGGRQRRPIEHVRVHYRPDDMRAAQNDPNGLLPLTQVQSLALPGESYKLAFTPGLLDRVYVRDGQRLLPMNPADVLAGAGADRGGYVDLDGDGHWWVPSGRVFHSPDVADAAAQELAYARRHFFLPLRIRDPFGHTAALTLDAYDLLSVETRDAVGNRVTVGERLPTGDLDLTRPGNDYRVLQPQRVMDPNRNRAAVIFDVLGMVVGTAIMGKPEATSGDSLDGFEADLPEAAILAHLADPRVDPHAVLRRATTRQIYDLFAYRRTKDEAAPQPARVYTLTRETHDADLGSGEQTRIQHSFSYSDGFGREIQRKIQAEPGPAPRRDANGAIVLGADGQPEMTVNDVDPRWVGSSWTVYNNKGKPVRQYEPFFTDTHRFEFDVRIGVSPVLFYDPVARVVATLHPNHTYEKIIFDPWQQTTYDVNDTVAAAGRETGDPRTDPDIGGFVASYFAAAPAGWQTWHSQRAGGGLGAPEQIAAAKAAIHANTPATAAFDTLGRPFFTVAHNRFERNGAIVDESYAARVELDIEGNQGAVRDASEQNGDGLGRIVMRYDYDLLGNRIHQASMEAGERWMLNDVTGKPVRAFDSRSHTFRTEYDPLRRPLRSFVAGDDPADPNRELLTDRVVYGEQHPEAEARNLRGQAALRFDQVGAATTEALDFKGNPLAAARRLARAYQAVLDWRAAEAVLPADATEPLNPVALEAALAPLLEAESYTSRIAYDALNRPVTLTTPHTPNGQPSMIRPGYNEANLLERVDANLRGEQANGQPVWTPFVTDIDYNAKGQRTSIDTGNGVRTTHEYDPLTFRLGHLQTLRGAEPLQDLRYTYDPAGNITAIRDDAQQTVYFRNQRVEPSAEYTYDAIYRLIEATGREHLGQTGGQRNPPTPADVFNRFHARLDHPGDGNAMGVYVERYLYDAVGNILAMQHRGSDPAHPGWTRTYTYAEASLVEPAKRSNRLSSTAVGGGVPESYPYDEHGNMVAMPHLPLMRWDYRDQLWATAQQLVTGGGAPETTWYVCDAGGQRVRKVTERQAAAGQTPARKAERLYLGGFEIYREYASDGVTVELERETLHLMDDQQRIALVESRTQGSDGSPAQLTRYQFDNHLGSASLELDDRAQIISYEEYTPYGSTSYQAVRSQTETPKRYRYTGMERDEENGLYYHGARYYASWLGRWTSADPAGLEGGSNLYAYGNDSPVRFSDPTGEQPEGEETNDVWVGGPFDYYSDQAQAARERELRVSRERERQKREMRILLSDSFDNRLKRAQLMAPSDATGRSSVSEIWHYGLTNDLFTRSERERVESTITRGRENKYAREFKRIKTRAQMRRQIAWENEGRRVKNQIFLNTIQGPLMLAVGGFAASAFIGSETGRTVNEVRGCIAGVTGDCVSVGATAVGTAVALRISIKTGRASPSIPANRPVAALYSSQEELAQLKAYQPGKGDITNARPIGKALKADPAHRSAVFVQPEAELKGHMFWLKGKDGTIRRYVQVQLDESTIADFIIDLEGNLTHSMIRKGKVTGKWGGK